MSLLYYMIYKCTNQYDNKGRVGLMTIQWLWLVLLPLLILKKLNRDKIIAIDFLNTDKGILLFAGMIAVLFFDYFYYFKEEKEKEILKKYTNRYKIIENYPTASYLMSFLSLLLIWTTLCLSIW